MAEAPCCRSSPAGRVVLATTAPASVLDTDHSDGLLGPTRDEDRVRDHAVLVASLEQLARGKQEGLVGRRSAWRGWPPEMEGLFRLYRIRVAVDGPDFIDPVTQRRSKHVLELQPDAGGCPYVVRQAAAGVLVS